MNTIAYEAVSKETDGSEDSHWVQESVSAATRKTQNGSVKSDLKLKAYLRNGT